MIVYHGSNSNFTKLRIAKSLVKNSSTLENEGPGIYFSTDKSVAKHYGKYVYTLDINDKYFLDSRNAVICKKYLYSIEYYIYGKSGIDISKYIELDQVADRIRWRGMSISGICTEIQLLLDSNEYWYEQNSKSNIDKVYSILRNYDKKHLKAFMINSPSKNIGVIKDVSPDIVQIIRKEVYN